MTKPTIINYMSAPPDKTDCYILKGENGDLLIDTGHFKCTQAVEMFATQYNVKWIFLTHGHFDHTWNAAYLKEKYGWKVILHEKDKLLYEKHQYDLLKPTRRKFKLRTKIGNAMVKHYVSPVCEVDYYLTDNDTDFLRNLGFDADVIMLPGHTYGSMGIMAGDVAYVGDACSSVKSHYRTVYLGVDVEAVRESEKKIRHLKPAYICAGHGSPINFEDEYDSD